MKFTRLLLAFVLLPCTLSAAEPEQWTANDEQLILQDVPKIPDELVQRLNRYQNVRSASFLDWTGDGKGIFIRTRFGEFGQIHRVDRPAGVRHQLTWFPEPVGQVIRQGDKDVLSITMDEGGGEHHLLPLPLGQVLAEDVPLVLHLEERQPPVNPLPDIIQSPYPARELKELLGRHEGGRRLGLGDDPHGPLDADAVVRGDPRGRGVALVGEYLTREYPEEGGLPRPVGAEEAEEISLVDCQGDVL